MREMKDSGIEWIGEIPVDWKVIKNKYLLSLLYSGGTPSVSNNEFYCFEGGIPFVSISDMSTVDYVLSTQKRLTNSGIKDKNLKVLPNGTILYSIYATVGAVSELKIEAAISQAMLALQVNSKVDKSFYKYNLAAMKDYIFSNTNGNTQFNLNAEKVKNFYFVLPDIETQQRIADYLDRKCSQIDAIIARQQEVIEKLKAYKLSVITESVTKGLNPDVPMKDSGVEWIGEIPEDWEVSKLKFMGHFVNGYAFPSSSFTTDGVRVMKIANIQPMEISWIDESYVDVSEYEKLPMYRVEQGDLVFALTRPIINGGIKVAIFDGKEKVLLNQRNAMFKGLSRVLPRWMYYVMQNQMYVQKFALYIDGTGQQPNISTNEISQIEIPIPPIEVQQQVIMKLNEVMASIEKMTLLKERMIKQLSDYKKSLIYEVVTGKKEV